MAETIWNGLTASYNFVMDNLVIINILLSLVIVFFQAEISTDSVDVAAVALFHSDSWIFPLFDYRTGFS
ncbi:MAG: hypothetical protein QM793_04295 [Muricomes sp.]